MKTTKIGGVLLKSATIQRAEALGVRVAVAVVPGEKKARWSAVSHDGCECLAAGRPMIDRYDDCPTEDAAWLAVSKALVDVYG